MAKIMEKITTAIGSGSPGGRGARVGLVLGKFAPFHKGHQFLVETALAHVGTLYVLIYDSPGVIDIPLEVRADWIRHLYPTARVIEGWGGPEESGADPRIMKLQEDFILKMMPGPVTHFFSSEWYGDHVSRALGAKNIIVDMKRKHFPISGTLIRSNPHAHRTLVHPYVYKDFVKKVVFLGAESSGKSTITEALAKEFGTAWMPEFGREYWTAHQVGGFLTPEQLVELAEEHLRREEEELLKSDRYLFVDTNAITTEMFARFYHGQAHSKLQALARFVEKRYDLTFLCGVDIPYEDDGTRSGAEHRLRFQQQIIDDLHERGIPYVLLEGDLHQRISTVKKVLALRFGLPSVKIH